MNMFACVKFLLSTKYKYVYVCVFGERWCFFEEDIPYRQCHVQIFVSGINFEVYKDINWGSTTLNRQIEYYYMHACTYFLLTFESRVGLEVLRATICSLIVGGKKTSFGGASAPEDCFEYFL